MQQMGPAALQTKPPMTEAEYFSDEKNYANAYAAAQARLEAAGPDTPVTPENIQAQMHNDYLAKQKFLQGLSQPQPNAPAAAPAANPQASYSGGQPTFGGSPVIAQGGFSQNGGQQYDPSMVQPIVDAMRTPAATSPAANRNGSSPYFGIALAPGHPDYKAPPTPTNRMDERGYVIMSDGSKVDPRDDFAMSTGGRGEQAVVRLTHPDGSQIERRPDYMMPENYLASNAQGGIQQNSMRLVGEPGIPNLIAGLGGPSDYQPQSNAQGGMGAPVGPGAYQPGSYTSPEVFGAANVLADPAKQQYAEVSGGNRDTQYALQNPQMSAGQAYFDPNNPVRQEMSAADQSMVNPQKQTLGKPGGRYGLGQIDYGINPATGNRVTASIRPGGTMPEYDEPVGKPGTAMGGGRGGLTIMGGKKKPATAATAATADVSPGGTPVNAGLAAAAPVSISRDDWRVKWAEMIAANPNASMDHKGMAVDIFKNAGLSEGEVAAMEAKGTAVQSERTSGEDERNAYETVKSQRKSAGETENAKKLLKANGWTDKEIENLGLGRPTRKPGPPKPTSKETEEMISYLQSGRASEAERQVIEGVLRAEGVDFDAKLRFGGKEASTSATASPGGDWKKYSDSTRRSGEAAPTSSSLLGQLEQAEPAPAGSVPPSPASGATQGQEELRTWTSVDGKTFEGSIVEGSLEAASKQPIGQQVITVKRKDGKVFNVAIEQLGEEDRAYLDASYKTRNTPNWTENKDSRTGKGESYQDKKPGKPAGKSTSKPKYIGKIPDEVYQRPPSSAMSQAKYTS
jgi:hypothetical protein